MAENVFGRDDELLRSIKVLLWGNTIKEDVFRRWAQGFFFSTDEPTALVQAEGGPCAVIAPVQAFILKQLLLETDILTWRTIKPEKCYHLLVRASVEILQQAAGETDPKFSVVHVDLRHSKGEQSIEEREKEGIAGAESKNENEKSNDGEEGKSSPAKTEGTPEDRKMVTESNVDSNSFHSQLRISNMNSTKEVEQFLLERLDMLRDRYGILLLLYSVIITKGIADISSEMSDPLESMIDSTYGYGSQSLINLMLTGRAVSHVWDHDQNIGGLKLQGIDRPNSVGFLALLEHLRYCEVGTFLKSPSYPVWVLGSETHLTVLFSTEKGLVSTDSPAEKAKRVFRKFDPEGNNFIPANNLQDVLAELELVADTEYVDIMRKKLDNENLGIILRASFMDEFFPEETVICPDTFSLYHYNGLQRSNPDNKIQYHRGQAVLLECTVKGILESNPMLTVLQTKWPRIEIHWDIGRNPSLN